MVAGNVELGARHNTVVKMREVPAEPRHRTNTVTGYGYFEIHVQQNT
jgi:hypothetical protein